MPKITFSSNATLPAQNALVLTVADGPKLGTHGVKLDKKLGGAIKRAFAASRFTGAKDQTLTIVAPAKTRLTQLILVGIGDVTKIETSTLERAGGAALGALSSTKETQAVLLVDEYKGMKLEAGAAAAHAAFGARLQSYSFEKYRTTLKPNQKLALKVLNVSSADVTAAKQTYAVLDGLADGVFFTRNLVSEPANILYPETLAEHCKTLKSLGVKVEVLDEKQMKKLGMNSLLAVGMGSTRLPRLVVMQWLGNLSAKDKKPVAFVGKGVTFDTGGYSLKPGAGMEKMKYDMGGAGAVIGAMMALAKRKAKANVIGVVGLAENMVSGDAYRPGDVITTMSGQTVEVLNTDAEGRMVLADALWYTQENFSPRCIIDLATLTGAMVVSLGHEYAGLFSNDDTHADQVTQSAKKAGEPVWRFPMGEAYDKDIDCAIADMKNIGTGGEAGSITAAQFLLRFVKKGVPWVHLDIAGMAWDNKGRTLCPKGATGYGVRLLDRFIADHHEGE